MFKEFDILKIFFEEPSREFNVREVARLLKLAPATASKELKEFAKQGILKERKERMLILYKSNLDHELYQDLKKFYILRILKDSQFIDGLNKFYLKPTIVLFGSAATGLDIEDSDLDLVIFTEKKKDFPKISEFEKKFQRKIQMFIISDIKELKNEHLMNNVLNGIVIQGEIKWI